MRLTSVLGGLGIFAGCFGLMATFVVAMFISLRLFWADKFVLVHDSGPLQALQQSWQLTRNGARQIFNFQFLIGLLAYPVMLAALFLFTVFLLPWSALESLGAGWLAEFGYVTLEFLLLFVTYAALHAPELA